MKKRVLIVCGGGGHNDEAAVLLPAFSGCDITFVTYRIKSTEGLQDLPVDRVIRVPLYSEVTSLRLLASLFVDFFHFCRIFRVIKPHLILSTGSEIAVPAFLAAVFCSKARRIHVETVTRIHDLTLSGKVLLRLSHRCYVQWPGLANRYPGKTVLAGRVF